MEPLAMLTRLWLFFVGLGGTSSSSRFSLHDGSRNGIGSEKLCEEEGEKAAGGKKFRT
jgi:hypothetical protein